MFCLFKLRNSLQDVKEIVDIVTTPKKNEDVNKLPVFPAVF